MEENIEQTFLIVDDDNAPNLKQLIDCYSKYSNEFSDLDPTVLGDYLSQTQSGSITGEYYLNDRLKISVNTPLTKDIIIQAYDESKKHMDNFSVNYETRILFCDDSKKRYLEYLLKFIKKYSEINLELNYAPGGIEYLKAKDRFENKDY